MENNKLPEGWEWKKLGEICEIFGGMPAPKEDFAFENGTIPFVRMQDLGRYHLTTNLIKTKDKFNPLYIRTKKLNLIKSGAILLPRSGSVSLNHRAILGVDAYIVSHICALSIKDDNLVDNIFLYYALCGIDMRSIMKKTTGLDAITFEDLKKIEVPVPHIAIQKQIVAILERAERLKQRREKANEETENVLQSTFASMFGDPIKNENKFPVRMLKEVTKEIQTGFAFGKFDISEGIPHLRPFNISPNGEFLLNEIKYVPEEVIKNEKYLLESGDILFNSTNSRELVGKTALFNLKTKCTFSNHITKVRIDNQIANSLFIGQIFKIYFKRGKFQTMVKIWVNQVGIDSKKFESMEIPIPPIKLQQEFAEIVEKIEKTKTYQEKSTQEINTLFDALMQKAFKGEL